MTDLLACIRSANLFDSVSTPDLSYPVLCDDNNAANNNDEMLFNICCENNLVVVNNFMTHDKHFINKKTYKETPGYLNLTDV